MGADTFIGDDVYNQQDEDLGDIKQISRIAYAVGFTPFSRTVWLSLKHIVDAFQLPAFSWVMKSFETDTI